MVIVDNVNRYMGGGDLNNNDMDKFSDGIDKLSAMLESPTMVVLHNNGKDDTRGARGSIRLSDDSDAIFELTAKKKDTIIESIKVRNEKQKEAQEVKQYGLVMKTIELEGEDEGFGGCCPRRLVGLLLRSVERKPTTNIEGLLWYEESYQ